MTTAAKNNNGRRFFARFRRGPAPLRVEGYHVGNILSDTPVFIDKKAAIVGNILAPAITIKGKVYGACAALETLIHENGEVWGDLQTHSFIVEPGGQVHGWVNYLDKSGFQSLVEQGELPDEVILSGKPDLPFELQTENIRDRSEAQIDMLRLLQLESATALAARAEMETHFNDRLNEIAGGSAEKMKTLNEQITAVHTKQTETESELAEANHQLGQLTNANQQISEELRIAQQLLSEKTNELEALDKSHQNQINQYETLSQAKADLEVLLLNAQNENEALNERIQSLEAALQSSLQHSAEQEDSLLRWQELSESNRKKVEGIEQELQSAQLQLEESVQVTEMIRAQRAQAEEQWRETTDQVDALNLELSSRNQELVAALAAQKELKLEIEALRQRPPDEEVQQKEQALLEAIDRIAELEIALAEADEAAQEYMEQHLWAKASLQTTQIKLDEMQIKLDEANGRIAALNTELSARQTMLDKVETDSTESIERLKKQANKQEAAVSQIKTLKQKAAAEKEALQESLLHMKIQAEAYEAEIEHHLGQVNSQGQRLAEAQALLVERDLAIAKMAERIQKQADFIARMKSVTSQHIDQLKAQLAQTRQGQ
ncbi:MAG: polymer-forming cytoskeletal protein [Anaerolineae bacterium]